MICLYNSIFQTLYVVFWFFVIFQRVLVILVSYFIQRWFKSKFSPLISDLWWENIICTILVRSIKWVSVLFLPFCIWIEHLVVGRTDGYSCSFLHSRGRTFRLFFSCNFLNLWVGNTWGEITKMIFLPSVWFLFHGVRMECTVSRILYGFIIV